MKRVVLRGVRLHTVILSTLAFVLCSTEVRDDATQLLSLINAERANSRLSPLSRVVALEESARWFADDLARLKAGISHTDSNGRRTYQRIYDFGYRSIRKSAENLARGTLDAGATLSCWMNSSGHRRNLLDPDVEHIGIGVSRDDNDQTYWVIQLAQRHRGAPPVKTLN